MDEQQQRQIKKYVGMAVRRKKLILFFLLLSMTAGLGVYLKTPKVYQSTALLIYQRARINPGSKMTPDVQTQTREMVATLTQQVTSRSSLEAIVKQFDLYKEARRRLPMEDIVDRMRTRHISIKPDRGDVFKVSFDGDDPKKVMQVTNALAARFIEENLRYREEKATETSAYVKDEMSIAKANLDKKEAAMRDYKLKYYNELPQQLEVNMTRLNALQEQYQNTRDSAQDLERTKLLIQEQISVRKEALAQMAAQARQMRFEALQNGVSDQDLDENPVLSDSMAQVAALRRHLDSLLSRYTEKHPEVRRVKKQLAQAEEKHAKLLESLGGAEAEKGQRSGDEGGGGMGDLLARDTQLQQLQRQLSDVSYALEKLKKERQEIKKQIDQLQKWIEMTPVREAEWSALTRDYKQLYDHYQQLVARNLEAESIQSLERRQKGSQFKIVDSAYLPEKPFKPDFKKIMLLSVALGLGLGGGLAFLLEMMDTSFREVYEVEEYLGLPVACTLPHLMTRHEEKVERLKAVAWATVFVLAWGGLLGTMAYLYKAGRIII